MEELQARSFIDKNFHAAFNKKHGTNYSQDELQSAFEKMIGEVPMDTPVTDTMIMKVLKKNESTMKELIESKKSTEEIVNSMTEEIYARDDYDDTEQISQDMVMSEVPDDMIDDMFEITRTKSGTMEVNGITDYIMKTLRLPSHIGRNHVEKWVMGMMEN